jgi:trimeric autotransporter adhesin
LTYEPVSITQAVRAKYARMTFERKIMSTKTSIKRIALVAVAALGFGMVSTVSANASAGDITMTYDFTATGSTTTPVVGSAVVIPVTLATSSVTTDTTGATATLTATLTTKPTNSALDTESATTASVSTNAFPTDEATMAATASTASVGAKLTATVVAAAATQSATVVGSFGFTPDTAGKYVLTLAVADTNATGGGTTTSAITTDTVEIIVGGASLVQASTGLGTASGTQNVGSQSAAAFFLPAASTTTSIYQVTATGANIVGAYRGTADAANANTYTSTTGIVKQDGTTFNSGITYTGQATVTAVTGSSDATDALIIQFTSATAGAATVTLKSINATTGALSTVSSVTVSYGAVPVISPSLSTAYLGQGNACATSAETTAIRVAKTAGVALTSTSTTGATLCVNLKNTSGSAILGQAVSVSVSGPGLITLASGNGTGSTGTVRAASLTATAMESSSQVVVGISADGTAGAGTITLTAGGVVIATKVVNFYGSVASLTATQNYKIARSGRTATSTVSSYTLGSSTSSDTGLTVATSPAVTIVAKDADGNVVPGVTVLADIADSTVLSAVNVTEAAGTALTIGSAGAGNFISNVVAAIGGVSGKSTTVTYKTAHPTVAGTYISATPVTFTLGGSKYLGKVTMKLNQDSYTPGEKMVLTFTAKDASGNAVYDGAAQSAATANKAVSGAEMSGVYVDGELVIGDDELLYAPSVSGAFSITAFDGTDALGVSTVTASAAVESGAAEAAQDAANEATDAANAATDAANAAAEAADAATAAAQDAQAAVAELATKVASLMAGIKAQITSLTNLVIKIQKKVRA